MSQIFSLIIFLFLLLSERGEGGEKKGEEEKGGERLYVGGRFGSYDAALLSFGLIQDNKWTQGREGEFTFAPLFSSADLYCGVVNESDFSILYFSGVFSDSHSRPTFSKENRTIPGVMKCILGSDNCALLPVGSDDSSKVPYCPIVPSITSHGPYLATICGGSTAFLGPDIQTAFLFDTGSLTWSHVGLPCDTPLFTTTYCNAKEVWRVSLPIGQGQNVTAEGLDYHMQHMIFSVVFPATNSYNLLYYTFKNGGWLWDYLLQANSLVTGSTYARRISSVAQNDVTGELFVSGTFIRRSAKLSLCYLIMSPADELNWNTNCNLAGESELQMIANGDNNLEEGDAAWLLIATGDYVGVCSGGESTSLAYLTDQSPNNKFAYDCTSNVSDVLESLSMSPEDPLAKYIVPQIPQPPDTYLSSFFTAHDASYTYATIMKRDVLDRAPPYVRVFDMKETGKERDLMVGNFDDDDQDIGEWSKKQYPPPLQATDLCPESLCYINMIPPSNIPLDYGSSQIFFTSTDKNFTQYISQSKPDQFFSDQTSSFSSSSSSSSSSFSSTSSSSSPDLPSFLEEGGDLWEIIFEPIITNVGEVRQMFESNHGPIALGHFFGPFGTDLTFSRSTQKEEPFANIAIMKQLSNHETIWVGLGSEGGIPIGALMCLVEYKNGNGASTYVIGGLFEHNNATNLAKLELHCLNELSCFSSEDWVPFDDNWIFSNNSIVSALAVYGKYFFIGGTFLIWPNGTVLDDAILNFGIWDLEEEYFLPIEGLEQNLEFCIQLFCPCIEVMRVINNELWIGGTFNTSKVEDGRIYYYNSLARLNLSSFEWLPVSGMNKELSPGRLIPATISTISFLVDGGTMDQNNNLNLSDFSLSKSQHVGLRTSRRRSFLRESLPVEFSTTTADETTASPPSFFSFLSSFLSPFTTLLFPPFISSPTIFSPTTLPVPEKEEEDLTPSRHSRSIFLSPAPFPYSFSPSPSPSLSPSFSPSFSPSPSPSPSLPPPSPSPSPSPPPNPPNPPTPPPTPTTILKPSHQLVQLYIGGDFNLAEYYPDVPYPFYNFAMSCIIFDYQNNSFLPLGIISEPSLEGGVGVGYNSEKDAFLPPSCQAKVFGFFEGTMGGTNGPVASITPLFNGKENDIIMGGIFSATLGIRDKASTSGCPLLKYDPWLSAWSAMPQGDDIRCFGSVLSLLPSSSIESSFPVWGIVLICLGIVVFFGVGIKLFVLVLRQRNDDPPVGQTFFPETHSEQQMPATPSTPLLANIKKVSRHSENLTEYYESVNSNLHPYTVIIKGISNRFDNGGEREREREREGKSLSLSSSLGSSWKEEEGEGKRGEEKSIYYIIDVACGVSKWSVQRSFVDFSVLQRILSQNYPVLMFPDFPPRDQERNRNYLLMRRQLQVYLRDLLDCTFEEGLSKVVSEPGFPPSFLLQPDLRSFLDDGQYKSQPIEEFQKVNLRDIYIKKRIGLGSYAEVYKGIWKGVEVAVKILLPSIAGQERLLESFASETALMSKLHHRNVLSFYGASCSPPNLCIVTEWMTRGRDSLFNIIHSKSLNFLSLPLGFRLKLAHDVALGVGYLHSLVPPVIHRDLKSLNLLVDQNWLVKVADFGLSRIKDFFEETSSIVGTPAWTAPEVLRGDRSDETADVYSFGIILWEISAGKRPFEGQRYNQVLKAVCDEGDRPPVSPNEDKEYVALMTTCWDGDRKRRPKFKTIATQIAEMMLRLDRERPSDRATRTISTKSSRLTRTRRSRRTTRISKREGGERGREGKEGGEEEGKKMFFGEAVAPQPASLYQLQASTSSPSSVSPSSVSPPSLSSSSSSTSSSATVTRIERAVERVRKRSKSIGEEFIEEVKNFFSGPPDPSSPSSSSSLSSPSHRSVYSMIDLSQENKRLSSSSTTSTISLEKVMKGDLKTIGIEEEEEREEISLVPDFSFGTDGSEQMEEALEDCISEEEMDKVRNAFSNRNYSWE